MTLIDTSAWIQTLRSPGDANVREKVRALSERNEVALCEPVLLELHNGHQKSKDKHSISDLTEVFPVYKCNEKIWQEAFALGARLRGAGVTVPNMDVLIYAIAQHHKLDIFAVDKHFDLIRQKLKK